MNWLPLLPFALFFLWLLFIGFRRSKTCPACGERLPRFQSPLTKTRRQWIEGGTRCPRCGTESTRTGVAVAPATPPHPRSLRVGLALLIVAVAPAAILIFALLQR